MPDALINGLSGAGAGIIAQLITYPLQTVNTRQQTERDSSKSAARDSAVRQMLEVVKHEGWRRLYGGLAPSLASTAASQQLLVKRNLYILIIAVALLGVISTFPANFGYIQPSTTYLGVYYYFYQILRNRAETAAQDLLRKGIGDGSVGMFQSLVVAALAGSVNVLLTNPIWVVVTRMQVLTFAIVQTHKKSICRPPNHATPYVPDEAIQLSVLEHQPYRTSHVMQELYDEAGFWGFWKGVTPTLIMVSNPSIQFMLYETLLNKIKKRRASTTKGAEGVTALEFFVYETLLNKIKKRRASTTKGAEGVTILEIFILGAVAKLGATVVTYPLLVVKARLQVKQGLLHDKRHNYTGTFDAISKMLQYEGFSSLYRGLGTKVVQSVFAAAVLFMVKEELVKAARVLVTGELRLNISKLKSL